MEKESETKTGGRIGIVDVRTVEIVRVRRPLKIQIGIPVYIGRYPRRTHRQNTICPRLCFMSCSTSGSVHPGRTSNAGSHSMYAPRHRVAME